MRVRSIFLIAICLLGSVLLKAQKSTSFSLESAFKNPSDESKPWVLWYWMHAAISKEGITADLEAMKEVGIAGAYLVFIYDTVARVPYDKPARQLTPEWWSMVNHAVKECKRLGLKLAYHVSDGFALAGGSWIKPDQSMQKVVWTKTYVKASRKEDIVLEQPKANENYYKDIAVFAYPANSKNAFAETVLVPTVTTSTGEKAAYLCFPDDNSKTFGSDSSCWIQYKYPKPFTLRSLKIQGSGRQYQAQRLIVQSSNDGYKFETIMRLTPPRHGWQDGDEGYTFSIPTTTAKIFRFVYDKEGTEAGAEDLDNAKWKPSLRIKGIYLSDEPSINQPETKNGSMWRVAENTTPAMVSREDAVPFKSIINLTSKLDKDGKLKWKPASGNWVIVRMGHTSTGHKNETGGAAKGLECDKFNPAAVTLQFNNWFAKVFEKTDPGIAKEVIKIFYIDSWEAGSQNWSKTFAAEFKKRRGYDLMPYLLVMAGTPIDDAATSEKILHDVRETIAELVNDVFYVTLRKLADKKGLKFTAENVAPTMMSDGLLHFKTVDYPTGEFWLNSPTHDKPNDMFDAISAGHIYGKNIIQAEAFTNLRIQWTEHPGNIKAVGDRNYAMGITRMIFHVMTHNPWIDRKPGMTLGTVGLFFQRDQTWFKQGRAWVDYNARVSSLLQQGKPVADIAVFTGEEVPRRSILPDRLTGVLPGIFGDERLAAEKIRLENKNQPQRSVPPGVKHSANMADPENWTDALRGYKYDCFNPDAFLSSKVVNGKLVMPGGLAYSIVVFPGKLLMNPNSNLVSLPVAKKILELKNGGVNIIIDKREVAPVSFKENNEELQRIWKQIFEKDQKSRLIEAPYKEATFEKLGVPRDLEIVTKDAVIAWAHRQLPDGEIYFIANQLDQKKQLSFTFRVAGYEPEIWDPVTGTSRNIVNWQLIKNRTNLNLSLDAYQSLFVVFRKKASAASVKLTSTKIPKQIKLQHNWKVQFDTAYGGPVEEIEYPELVSWSESADSRIKYYSGTAIYKNTFDLDGLKVNKVSKPIYLSIDSIYNIASVYINGIDCGTLWTKPYKLDISKAVHASHNTIEIKVTNTWANRLIGDERLPESEKNTWTTYPLSLKGRQLEKAGLVGEVSIWQ